MPYIAVVLKESDDELSIRFPDLPGCTASGSTLAQVRRFAVEALALHLETLRAGRQPIPPARTVEELREDSAYRYATFIIVDPSLAIR
jgi:predicted RNase H-like HicB family nuclease